MIIQILFVLIFQILCIKKFYKNIINVFNVSIAIFLYLNKIL